jgi:uncharacterized membrane protein
MIALCCAVPSEMPGALARTAISAGVAVALGVGLVVATRLPLGLAALAAWNAGGLCLLALAWFTIAGSTPERTRRRASREDPGRTTVYVVVLLGAGVSLLSAVVLVRSATTLAGPRADFLVALCLANVLLSWALTHTAFALRYAHLYYRDDEDGTGGVDFPGGAPPTYVDFAYLAFTIGMTFQVSDTSVSGALIRRAVLLHATLSFVYNTAILAFVLNLIFGIAR